MNALVSSPNAGLPAGFRKKRAADGLLSHEDVNYQAVAKNPDEACAKCSHWSKAKQACELVSEATAQGWCVLFKEAEIGATDSALALAFDKNSVRSFDSDGRMRVSVCNISKANICPYKGEEIPGYEDLGLERDKVYQMFRDPRELEAAAPTFNGVQLLKKHVAVDADDHQMWDIVGCTGTEAKFDGMYLTNSLSVWTKEGIDFIESGDQRELSCGYHYVADMTPGNFGGKHYDGVMRNIEGNHVALVEEGRAGHDVVVGDSALSERDDDMKPTRLEAFFLMTTARAVNPLLAMDAKVNYAPIFKGLTTKNFKQRRSVIMDGLKKVVTGKTIAKDASLEHVAEFLNKFEHTPGAEKSWDESVSEPQHKAMEAAAHGKSTLGIPKKVGEEFAEADKGKKFGDMIRDWASAKDWSGGMTDDDLKALDKMHADCGMGGQDEEAALDGEEETNIEVEEGEDGFEQEEEGEEGEDGVIEEGAEEADDARHARDRRGAKDRRDAKDRKGAKDKHGKDRKGAMDKKVITGDDMNRAISSAVAMGEKKRREEMEARAFVRPFVGEIALAMDSAEKVHRAAAKILKIDGADDVHASALKPLIKMAGDNRAMANDTKNNFDLGGDDGLAMDEATTKTFDSFFPGASRIGQV